jgi:hypothetical protein
MFNLENNENKLKQILNSVVREKTEEMLDDELAIRLMPFVDGLYSYEYFPPADSFLFDPHHAGDKKFFISMEAGRSLIVASSKEDFDRKRDMILSILSLVFQHGNVCMKRSSLWKEKRDSLGIPVEFGWEFIMSILIDKYNLTHPLELYIVWIKFLGESLDEDKLVFGMGRYSSVRKLIRN